MAVIYMRKLEEEPQTYDVKFKTLTKGVNLKVQDWILNQIQSSLSILEIGCGSGILAKKMALKGNEVLAIDKNFQMINHAMQNYPSEENVKLIYQIGDFQSFKLDNRSKDVIVSTFALSELRPFEQQIFLRFAWNVLKLNGRLLIADEFIPSGFWKLQFALKRWYYKKKMGITKIKNSNALRWFLKYVEAIGFKIKYKKIWNHGTILAIELVKIKDNEHNEPDYYSPKSKSFKGLKSQLRIYRCLFTGQIDYVPIEPGVYKSGNPIKSSPIIVTANYDYTYIKVMRNLKGLDAWVLCIDTNGINVWCAARGDDFNNNQLLEAVEATGIWNLTDTKTLILPQLAAGGISIPQLPKKSDHFPFKITYGPIWSKYLPDYLEDPPLKKPEQMKLAKFTINHRIRAGITHITFLFRKIFLLPLILLAILLFFFNVPLKLYWIIEISLWILVINGIITIFFPLSNFTRRFIIKGFFFALINTFIISGFNWILHPSLLYILLTSLFIFWLGFFSTMSFSGYTMSTNPREIQEEYPIFTKINKLLMLIGLIFLALSIIFF